MADQTTTAPDLTEADRSRIAARYPRRRSGSLVAVLGLVLLAALIGWTVWAGLSKATPGLRGPVGSSKVVDDAQIDVVLKVHRTDPSRGGTCTVQAQAPNGETVAELDVAVPPSSQKDVNVSASLKTYLRSHTAVLAGCSLT